MPKAVKGFTIENGEFYENESEANYEETKYLLQQATATAIQVTQQNFSVFLEFIENNASLVERHCQHFKQWYNVETDDDNDSAKHELATMQKGEVISDGPDKKS